MKEITGKIDGKNRRVAVVVSRFNEFITRRLLKGCLDELARCGVKQGHCQVVWVPGAYEIPLAAFKLAKRKNVDAVICLGAVIRGETLHFELVAWGCAQGIAEAALKSGKPVILGVLAVDTVNQACKRAEEKGDNKGREAAQAALEMASVVKEIERSL